MAAHPELASRDKELVRKPTEKMVLDAITLLKLFGRGLAVCLICLPAPVAWAQDRQAKQESVWLDHARVRYGIPGLVIAVVQRGEPVQYLTSGYCDIARARGCTPSNPFPVGSITKSLTGLLAAHLAAKGTLDLDRAIRIIDPTIRLPDDRAQSITLRDLLDQRSGLGSVDWPFYWNPELPRKQYLARLPAVPPLRAFRSGFAYANANFVIAGKVIESASGSSWESLMRKELLLPLGMNESGFGSPGERTIGYGPPVGDIFTRFPDSYPVALRPAGGLVTTARDFARLLTMLVQGGEHDGRTILSKQALDIAFAADPARRGGYTFGIVFTRFRGQRVYHHTGAMAGFSSAYALVPGKWATVILSNRTGTMFPEGLAFAMLDRHLGGEGDEALASFGGPVQQPASTCVPGKLAPVTVQHPDPVGVFRHPAWGAFIVSATPSGHRIQIGAFSAPLTLEKPGSYCFAAAPGWESLRITSVLDATGRVNRWDLNDAMHPTLQRFTRAAN